MSTLTENANNYSSIKISWDLSSKITTFIFIAILIISYITISNFSYIFTVIYAVVLLIVIPCILNFFPIGFIINSDCLIIKRFIFKNIEISKEDIISINKVPANSFTTMDISSQGVFGFLGIYKDGTISMSTSLKDNIIVKTGEKFIIISPINTDFISNFLIDNKKE